ncbi:sulfate adenylyltransferase subunit 1 [Melioribacteraceae bacterium 4301-Me]|uniref:sulfate adenylyltransferase subunit 1 n=1 Tax=Pyranulibacter aquaticus TaxID=3163344 RepID=UPI003597E5A0
MTERMNIVIVGHVDHGKSTLIGRLLADTNSLPNGKLEQTKRKCELNSKPFEYAFLLDALVDEQAQGITIDTARVFFKTKKREYIIIDAPGHIEFLKNMVSGAARAEAAILLIDANEGIAENTKRHAFMLSLLGIRQVVVAINKMDLVNYSKSKFDQLTYEYSEFLESICISPLAYVPISAREGINLIEHSYLTNWYDGPTVIELIDNFEKEKEESENNFRMFVQGVYKFTANNDNRRIIAGTINSGTIEIGDEIIFLPSGKKSTVKTIEMFGKHSISKATAGQAIGLTLNTQIYVKPSELICKAEETLPYTSNRFKANVFWMGKKNLTTNKIYKLKIGTNKVEMRIEKLETVLDASSLQIINGRTEVHKHEVAQLIIETRNPISFDLINQIKDTSRFVIVDDYDIAGGGIITESLQQKTEGYVPNFSDFENELYNLIKKHFPHWELKPIRGI